MGKLKNWEHELVSDGISLEGAIHSTNNMDFAKELGSTDAGSFGAPSEHGFPVKGAGVSWESVDSGMSSSADSGDCVDGDGQTGEGAYKDSTTYPTGMGEAKSGFRANQRKMREYDEDDERGALR